MTTRPQQQLSADPLHPQPRRRRRSIRIVLFTGGLIVLLGVGGVAWWLFSPLVLHSTGKDVNQFAQAPLVGSTATPRATLGSVSTPTPTGPVILASGKFIDKPNSGVGLANDHGSGNVTIGRTADGRYQLYFDHLKVTNGPDLHVYLASTRDATDAEQVKREGVDLGLLKATEGSLNVPILVEAGRKLMAYHAVVIVCKTFSVIFTSAPLSFSAGG